MRATLLIKRNMLLTGLMVLASFSAVGCGPNMGEGDMNWTISGTVKSQSTGEPIDDISVICQFDESESGQVSVTTGPASGDQQGCGEVACEPGYFICTYRTFGSQDYFVARDIVVTFNDEDEDVNGGSFASLRQEVSVEPGHTADENVKVLNVELQLVQ